MTERLIVDSQPQFCVVYEGKVYALWSKDVEALNEERAAVARRLGVSVSELVPMYRVLVCVASAWTRLDSEVDWDGIRSAWAEWEPPGDARRPVWDGQPW